MEVKKKQIKKQQVLDEISSEEEIIVKKKEKPAVKKSVENIAVVVPQIDENLNAVAEKTVMKSSFVLPEESLINNGAESSQTRLAIPSSVVDVCNCL